MLDSVETILYLGFSISTLLITILIVLVVKIYNRVEEKKSGDNVILNSMDKILRELNDLKIYISEQSSKGVNSLTKEIKEGEVSLKGDIKKLSLELSEYMLNFSENHSSRFQTQVDRVVGSLKEGFQTLNSNYQQINVSTDSFRKELVENLKSGLESLNRESSSKLDLIRSTVDEKLQSTLEKRLGESFNLVSKRLEDVSKGLGEMQNLARGVGDLKRVLSGVKTRGILGEVQLQNILEQVLAPNQYLTNTVVDPLSKEVVEFAILLPGDGEREILLPMDSKFPLEVYAQLVDAKDIGDKTLIDQRKKELNISIYNSAKEISSKYIKPPYSTDFAIMFLPIESLYGEVLSTPGIVEDLQKKFKITIAGPTNCVAFLNSLRMGFKTLAVQKRSGEVWKTLSEVKMEFNKFSDTLDKAYKQINGVEKTLDSLRTTRVNQINRKLRSVEESEGSTLLD